MRRVVSAVLALGLISGCSTRPASPQTGKGEGAAYMPVVDMVGVEPAAFASDLDACRNAAEKIRVMRTLPTDTDTLDALAIGVAIVFPLGVVAAAALGGIAAVVTDSPNGVPADPKMKQLALVNCMAMRGYKNLDPNVTATYVVLPKTDLQTPRKTGQDTYVAESFAKANQCSAAPRAVLEDKGPGFERYSVACADGRSMKLRCEFGNCTLQVAAAAAD
ncbi:hypothetical protein QTH87_21020 [Variovorax sp. J22P168]|uniref:hypothetical protein n=1 Tax=Variovorax jilinensis TaxID=3053513 RepID=UPI002575B183|nr:hypothetical protein [Variovorax sp. J22P168]MDM0014940.1 hypothetical protein [Variovorax sp. J22P168]